eukprot:TRINITY_DN537_c0_g1_i1.p1 TRINITY_DN537_c0_g1~~TRINITY_DN537_c0_g1_i1.p1  ORF type:complete len:507 (-),score=118.14 TRINITY_DN537_c0_g1_i1:1422-2765(-)
MGWTTCQGTTFYNLMMSNSSQTLYSTRYPAAFVLPVSSDEISKAITCANSNGLNWTVRAGGHSYEAGSLLSNGVVIDMQQNNQITINTTANTVKIGAGQRLGPIYKALAAVSRALSGGTGPAVGATGMLLGGGIGHSMRKLGVASDQILSAKVVLANGTQVTCSSSAYSDLFWAIRGGGPFYGVVSWVVLKITAAPSVVTVLNANFAASDVTKVIQTYNNWKPWALNNNYGLVEVFYGYGSCKLVINYWGVKADVLAAYASSNFSSLQSNPSATEYDWTSFIVQATNLYGQSGWNINDLSFSAVVSQTTDRSSFKATSLMYTSAMPQAAIDSLVTDMKPQSSKAFIQLRALGGQMSALAMNSTGWAHRDKVIDIQVYTADSSTADATWVKSVWTHQLPYTAGATYYNYLDCDISGLFNYSFGANAARLLSIKSKYDPMNRIKPALCA